MFSGLLLAGVLAACGFTGPSTVSTSVATSGSGSCPLRITGVAGLDAGVNLPLIITGTCLGEHRPYQGWSPLLRLQDLTLHWSAGWKPPTGQKDSEARRPGQRGVERRGPRPRFGVVQGRRVTAGNLHAKRGPGLGGCPRAHGRRQRAGHRRSLVRGVAR